MEWGVAKGVVGWLHLDTRIADRECAMLLAKRSITQGREFASMCSSVGPENGPRSVRMIVIHVLHEFIGELVKVDPPDAATVPKVAGIFGQHTAWAWHRRAPCKYAVIAGHSCSR